MEFKIRDVSSCDRVSNGWLVTLKTGELLSVSASDASEIKTLMRARQRLEAVQTQANRPDGR